MAKAEVILLRETTRESVLRDTYTGFIFAALIGLGWWIGSDAMQWFGGFLGVLMVLARASSNYSKSRCTISDARERLDRMEASNGDNG